jgi:hypothetical protein
MNALAPSSGPKLSEVSKQSDLPENTILHNNRSESQTRYIFFNVKKFTKVVKELEMLKFIRHIFRYHTR